MDNLNLMEFGGTGHLILTAICDFDYNGISYKTGDIVLDLKDSYINFNYGSVVTDIKSSRNQVYYNEYYLDNFVIDVAPLNLQTQQLFSKMSNNKLTIVEKESATAMMGQLLLIQEPDSDGIISIEGISNYELIINNGVPVIRSAEFQNGQNYDVFYKKTLQCNTLELDNSECDLPYLKAQILFKGNNDKTTSINYFVIEKTALRLTPMFNLRNNSVSHIKLMFKVIDSEHKPTLSVMNYEHQ